MIEIARTITGVPIQCQVVNARPGDPAELVADASLAKRVLGWKPQVSFKKMVAIMMDADLDEVRWSPKGRAAAKRRS